MQLIYRGETIKYSPRCLPIDRKPRAVNWRYQIPGQTIEYSPRRLSIDRKLRTVNWRYQIPGEI
ncbi:hypothetical protein [Stenomitos frigidus]|nr:hypothetical protein [Stenomitos frigidus]